MEGFGICDLNPRVLSMWLVILGLRVGRLLGHFLLSLIGFQTVIFSGTAFSGGFKGRPSWGLRV